MNVMIDQFVNIYRSLGPDFKPAHVYPISFPQYKCNLDKHECDYSENSYIIHAVSRMVDPIFNYYKWKLKHSWEEVFNSSQN
ncbi:hypothetical protein RclHR1_08210004 [Rhizophagus clarus]|uniref:Uncharacterized protein n=1 Tax=Rhizophagus clarus TaxID=94130 RepID=A0A2Z6SN29_9GLOM|nr:hypothetical protein RclHR1_08210004 [Rhizophagus clarus]